MKRKEIKKCTDLLNRERGITLIALVVTIVVLLILAGVSISLILDNNGIIAKSKYARKEYGQARENEQKELDEVSSWIEKQIDEKNDESKLPETNPYLPSGFIKEDTDLNDGLVIKDGMGNEYVWVEVPRTESVYATAGLNISEFSDSELNLIKKDLRKYAKNYGTTSWDDTWYSGCGISDPTTYSNMYNKMLKSVYLNGGFWIGRYEIGDSEATSSNTGRTSSSGIEHTPVIKANQIPYTYITCSQAESLAETFAPSGYTSSLMFGLQWDLVCKHLETKGTNPGTTADSLQNAIKNNSTDWGNFYDASFDVINADARYSEDDGASWKKVSEEADKKYSKASSKSVLLTTGAGTRNSMLNICDLAGNVWEWTLENYTLTTSSANIKLASINTQTGVLRLAATASEPCNTRGGSYNYQGSNAFRYGFFYVGSSNKEVGFRVTLY